MNTKNKSKKSTSTDTSAESPDTIFGVIKGGKQIQAIPRDRAVADLGTKFNDAQIEKLIEGDALMPSAKVVYCVDKAKLEAMIVEKGWDKAKSVKDVQTEQDAETSYAIENPNIESFEIENAQSDEPTFTAKVVADKIEEIDLADPHQPIYDAFTGTDASFAQSLNKTERGLLDKLVMREKAVASLSVAENKTWTSIRGKYDVWKEVFASEPEADDEPESVTKPEPELSKEGAEQFVEDVQSASDAGLLDNPETALVKDDAIQAIPELPLTKTDEKRFNKLKQQYREADNLEVQIPFVKARILEEIRQNKLFRKDYKTFGDFAFKEFSITREYAQQLAAIAGYPELVAETNSVSESVRLSVNAAIQMDREFGKLADDTGIDREFRDTMRPLMRDVVKLLVDVSPKDERGNIIPSPRVVTNLLDTVRETVKSGTVDIGGEQMTVEEAQSKNLLGASTLATVLEASAESIKSHRQTIIQDAQRRNEKRTEPHAPVAPKKTGKDIFKGVVPTYSVKCSAHKDVKDNFVKSVFNAGFEFLCGCRYQLLVGQGDVPVCIETDGKTVVYD